MLEDHSAKRGSVNEIYMRLLGSQAPELRDRSHSVAIATKLIRQMRDADLLALNDALTDLYRIDERTAQIVDMKFFGGVPSPETAEVLGFVAGKGGPRVGHARRECGLRASIP